MDVDLAQFLAAIIDVEGGEYRLPYASLVKNREGMGLALDIEDDGETLVLRLVDMEGIEFDDDDSADV